MRLAALDAAARAALARDMADIVLAAAAPLPVSVVCDDVHVRTWAESVGADVIWTPGLGLNGAVQAGRGRARRPRGRAVVVAHADLPLATSLAWVAATDGRHPRARPPPRRHQRAGGAHRPRASASPTAAARSPATVPRPCGSGSRSASCATPGLGWDVDFPADLALPAHY